MKPTPLTEKPIRAYESYQEYGRLKEMGSLTELTDYSKVTVEGTRVGGKVVIPAFVTMAESQSNFTFFPSTPHTLPQYQW